MIHGHMHQIHLEADHDETKRMVTALSQVILTFPDANMGTIIMALTALIGETLWQLEEAGITTDTSVVFKTTQMIAEAHIAMRRLHSKMEAQGCEGTA